MKIISILKFDNNYEELNKNTHNIKSLEFINKIFSQEMYDIKELKIKIKIKLRNYQLNGINWLLFLGSYGLGLALCDDMGLGKTIQTLVCIAQASIEYKKQNKKNPISLIICPTTLILNWIMECKKFFDENEITFVSYDKIDNTILPEVDIEKLLTKGKFKEVNPHNVNPNYLKKTEAEEKLNDKNNN